MNKLFAILLLFLVGCAGRPIEWSPECPKEQIINARYDDLIVFDNDMWVRHYDTPLRYGQYDNFDVGWCHIGRQVKI